MEIEMEMEIEIEMEMENGGAIAPGQRVNA